jgi:hypothetical protein
VLACFRGEEPIPELTTSRCESPTWSMGSGSTSRPPSTSCAISCSDEGTSCSLATCSAGP